MLDFNFAKLFSILGIGLFTAFFALYIIYLTSSLFSKVDHRREKRTFTTVFLIYLDKVKKIDFWINGLTILLFTFLFGFGTIIHEIAHKLTVQNNDQWPATVWFKQKAGLQVKGNIFVSMLVNEKDSLTAFGVKIFGNDSIINTVNRTMDCNYFKLNDSLNVREYWALHCTEFMHDTIISKQFKSYVDEISFLAKNWCYLCTDRVAEELASIDDKINFSRCIALVSAIYIGVIVIIYPFFGLRWFFLYYRKKKKFGAFLYSFWMPLVFLCLLQFLARTAYPISQSNFNKRILGYYLNHFSYDNDFK